MGDYLVLFVTGLLGSGHCVGMCGPIVLAYSMQMRPAPSSSPRVRLHAASQLAVHLTYNLGRVLMWTFLGALLGLAGAFFVSLVPAQRIIAVAGGLAMIVLGVSKLGLLPALQPLARNSASATLNQPRLFSPYRRILHALIAERSITGKFALGLANGLLPCGFSMAMLAKAASSYSIGKGALTMFSFGLGTIPALLFVGLLSTKWNEKQRRCSEAVASSLVIVMGVLLVLRGLGWHPPLLPTPGGSIRSHH